MFFFTLWNTHKYTSTKLRTVSLLVLLDVSKTTWRLRNLLRNRNPQKRFQNVKRLGVLETFLRVRVSEDDWVWGLASETPRGLGFGVWRSGYGVWRSKIGGWCFGNVSEARRFGNVLRIVSKTSSLRNVSKTSSLRNVSKTSTPKPRTPNTKHRTPNTNPQTPIPKHQTPNPDRQTPMDWGLGFGGSGFERKISLRILYKPEPDPNPSIAFGGWVLGFERITIRNVDASVSEDV